MRRSIIGRALLCATSLLAACADTPTGALAVDRGQAYDSLWRDIDRHYPYFVLNGVNWDSVGLAHRRRALEAATDGEFVMELGALLAELRDPHVSITAPGISIAIRYIAPFDTMRTYFDARRTVTRYVAGADTTAVGKIVSGWLSARVAYVRIGSFAGAGWAGEVEHAVDQLGPKGLIIDLRGNLGGDRSTALRIANAFADRSRPFGFLRYRNGPAHDALTSFEIERVEPSWPRRFTGPIHLIVNRRVASSAEEFVLAMRALPNVTIIGDTTGGASGGPMTRFLPNGWRYQYSRWIEYTSAGVAFQGHGIPPDVVVRPTAADSAAGRDVVLERALAMNSGALASAR